MRLIVGISDIRGVEMAHFVPETFNSDYLIDFLRTIATMGGPIAIIFLDQAPYPTSQKTKEAMDLLGLKLIFNTPC